MLSFFVVITEAKPRVNLSRRAGAGFHRVGQKFYRLILIRNEKPVKRSNCIVMWLVSCAQCLLCNRDIGKVRYMSQIATCIYQTHRIAVPRTSRRFLCGYIPRRYCRYRQLTGPTETTYESVTKTRSQPTIRTIQWLWDFEGRSDSNLSFLLFLDLFFCFLGRIQRSSLIMQIIMMVLGGFWNSYIVCIASCGNWCRWDKRPLSFSRIYFVSVHSLHIIITA